jgi:putative methyltransferase (TIGR04325 family)
MDITNDMTKPFFIWEGIYSDFKSAMMDANGNGFCGDIYQTRSLQAATECLSALKTNKPIPAFHKQRSTHLPPVVAMMLSSKKKIKILDFGGGLGIGYMTLMESIPADLKRVAYTVVEVPEVSSIGLNLHAAAVNYVSNLPIEGSFDLIHAASSFQYVENWQDLVENFVALKPEYILLSDVFAGSIKTYVTLQNYYESKIPHWFLNLNELLASFDKYGYKLCMKSFATSRRLDAEDILPMTNFPEDLRLNQTLHLLFQKSNDG